MTLTRSVECGKLPQTSCHGTDLCFFPTVRRGNRENRWKKGAQDQHQRLGWTSPPLQSRGRLDALFCRARLLKLRPMVYAVVPVGNVGQGKRSISQ